MGRRLWVLLCGLVALEPALCQDVGPTMRAVEIRASSTLVETGQGERYAAYKAFDGDPASCWVEGKSDNGIGESVSLVSDREVSVDAIVLMPGLYLPEYYKSNNRIKKIKVETENTSFTLSCEDVMEPQRFPLGKPIGFRTIRLEIVEVYPGSQWKDTCLSEAAFYSGGKRIWVDVSAQMRWRGEAEGRQVTVDGIPTLLLKELGRTKENTLMRLRPSAKNVAVKYTDYYGNGATYDWLPGNRAVYVVGRTLEKEKVGEWNTYWYLVEVPADAEGSVGLRWVVGECVRLSEGREPSAAKPPEGFVLVEGGTFQMGDTAGDNMEYEKPVHSVSLSSYYLGKYEVTQKQWVAVMGSNPNQIKGDDLPVGRVSWFDAVEFCNRLSAKEGLQPCYTISGSSVSCDFSKNGYRLPTEAEWEYAARGGRSSRGYRFAGGNNVEAVGWYNKDEYPEDRERAHPVGGKQGNELGIFDMSGNAAEWCWDWYGSYSAGPQSEPHGPSSGRDRVYRGGSASMFVMYLRCAARWWASPSGACDDLGFRLARSPT